MTECYKARIFFFFFSINDNGMLVSAYYTYYTYILCILKIIIINEYTTVLYLRSYSQINTL